MYNTCWSFDLWLYYTLIFLRGLFRFRIHKVRKSATSFSKPSARSDANTSILIGRYSHHAILLHSNWVCWPLLLVPAHVLHHAEYFGTLIKQRRLTQQQTNLPSQVSIRPLPTGLSFATNTMKSVLHGFCREWETPGCY